ncbi:MAG: serine hydrolase, partial [Saprospiraceae bacterium]|nr:serine hydrolase [Saprospiraceae bacterium]
METINRRIFLHNLTRMGLGAGLLPVLPACKSTSGIAVALDQVSPESQGVDSQAIIDFIHAADACDYEWHSFMILRHGKVVAKGWWDPFKPEYVHTLYSLSKSFTSTAAGFAREEGKIHLDDKVVSFFPDLAKMHSDPNLHAMTIRHLLTMNTGHEVDSFTRILTNFNKPWIPGFFEHPVEHPPGSKFVYDTGATFMLSAIVQMKVGMPIIDYLKPRLFDPLGIKDFDWVKSPEGICAGGFGLRVTTEAIARFGQTYLDGGKWNGKQVVPGSWVDEATAKHTDSNPGDSEWSNGYGYQFWRCKLPNTYRGDGAYGQYCIVMPDQDAVVAVTSESWDMGKSMQIIFDHLVPGMSNEKVSENKSKLQELRKLQDNLSLKIPQGNKNGISELTGKKYRFDNNDFGVEKVELVARNNSIDFIFSTSMGEQKITAGIEQWLTNPASVKYPFPVFFRTDHPSKIGATATLIEDNNLQLNIKMLEGIHGDQLNFAFSGNEV